MPDQVAEIGLNARTQLQPCLGFNFQSLEDRRCIGGYAAPFVFAQYAPGPIEQFQEVV